MSDTVKNGSWLQHEGEKSAFGASWSNTEQVERCGHVAVSLFICMWAAHGLLHPCGVWCRSSFCRMLHSSHVNKSFPQPLLWLPCNTVWSINMWMSPTAPPGGQMYFPSLFIFVWKKDYLTQLWTTLDLPLRKTSCGQAGVTAYLRVSTTCLCMCAFLHMCVLCDANPASVTTPPKKSWKTCPGGRCFRFSLITVTLGPYLVCKTWLKPLFWPRADQWS